MRAPKDPNAGIRLAYLASCKILDTAAEPQFDAIVAEASKCTRCPTVLISLLDTERQWFKSRIGITICETDLEHSFCTHAILESKPLVVEDATMDSRFADNILVTDEPRVRFYIGVPLRSPQGVPYGTLCAIDYVPRKVQENEISDLKKLAHSVENLIEMRKLGLQARKQQAALAVTQHRIAELKKDLAA